MSERWRQVDELSRDLALAVGLVDSVVGGRPIGSPRVRVLEADERPFRNRSGYYLFFDLPAESVTVAVDGGDYYADAKTTVTLDPTANDTHDVGEAVELALEPTTAYRFPAGLTRLRGTLWDGDTPVPGATVTVPNSSRTFDTTAAGEFVYYFEDIDPDDVTVGTSSDDRYFKPSGVDPMFIVDGTPGHLESSVKVEVGTLTTTDLHY